MYTIEQILSIKNGDYVVPQEVAQLLASIEKNIDIPVIPAITNTHGGFQHDRPYRHNKYEDKKHKHTPILVRSTKFAALEDENVPAAPVFKATKFAVKTGITKQINEIRMKINNISAATYAKISVGIIDLISQWKEESENVEEDMKQIAETIFDIMGKTKMNSELNADLYKLCVDRFDGSAGIDSAGIFTKTLHTNIVTLENMVQNVEYADPNQDYDKYCVYSKQISQIIAMCSFYVNCTKISIIPVNIVYSFLHKLLDSLDTLLQEEGKIAEVELIADIVFVVVESCHQHMVFDKPELLKKVVDIAGYKNKQFPSISNRFIFKFMDMRDLVNK